MFLLPTREWVSMLTVKCCLDNFNTEPVTFCRVRRDYYPGPVNAMQSMLKFSVISKTIMKHVHYISHVL